MGWFGGNSAPIKISAVTESPDPSKQPQQYLEDLPPKFEDNGVANQGQGQGQNSQNAGVWEAAMDQFKWSDFTVDRFVGMPCFREAMLTGFQAMGVLGVVTFLIHKNPSRSLNWSIGGFFLGNVVGWEQCRSIRRRSFETVEKARQRKEESNAKKLSLSQDVEDLLLKKFNEVQNHDSSAK
ncbi:Cytochrome c oxidase assembly protein cox20, mitochondrial [Scheffersomyces spartinae]|uniref:Cytochrome c oxidase assembly protein COX20, mitochondrial n=1 Tax=Scheffersomyces spartinae TaxID=45513 RepID=A0A9P7V7I6_9ASCO|nr:Cytochrome c oxidase assembly protein cox20, mitochondrial [Scheffersomyces spartinae]KAG7192617.1 Cytochrome c oxidase assembly protein cox20, mitochondrial [Scheffersomyces spartinae]